MADVLTRKLAFVHSVDIRGDTDELWTRGITYLVKNYLLAGQSLADVARKRGCDLDLEAKPVRINAHK